MAIFKATYYDIEHGIKVCKEITVESSYISDDSYMLDEWSRALTRAIQKAGDMCLVQLEFICD